MIAVFCLRSAMPRIYLGFIVHILLFQIHSTLPTVMAEWRVHLGLQGQVVGTEIQEVRHLKSSTLMLGITGS